MARGHGETSHAKSAPVHVLFENPDWLPPLLEALEREGFEDVRLVELDEGLIDPNTEPPEGIWINRISPSSHTRGHDGTVQLGREVLFWLEAHGRRVLNGLAAFELEMSKFRQDIVLRRWGIQTPKTVLAIGRDHILAAAERFDGPFITKHNQGGKGLAFGASTALTHSQSGSTAETSTKVLTAR